MERSIAEDISASGGVQEDTRQEATRRTWENVARYEELKGDSEEARAGRAKQERLGNHEEQAKTNPGEDSQAPPDMGNPSHIPNPQGFDEFMNVVIDETLQIYQPKKDGGKAVKESEELGRILLKGE